jgi:hypothetical protein
MSNLTGKRIRGDDFYLCKTHKENNFYHSALEGLRKLAKTNDNEYLAETKITRDIPFERFCNSKYYIDSKLIYKEYLDDKGNIGSQPFFITLKLSRKDFMYLKEKEENINELVKIEILKKNGTKPLVFNKGIVELSYNFEKSYKLVFNANKEELKIFVYRRYLPLSKNNEEFPFYMMITINDKILKTSNFFVGSKESKTRTLELGRLFKLPSFKINFPFTEIVQTSSIKSLWAKIPLSEVYVEDYDKLTGSLNSGYPLKIKANIPPGFESYHKLKEKIDNGEDIGKLMEHGILKEHLNSIPKCFDPTIYGCRYFHITANYKTKVIGSKLELNIDIIKKESTNYCLPLSKNHGNFPFFFVFRVIGTNEVIKTNSVKIFSKRSKPNF